MVSQKFSFDPTHVRSISKSSKITFSKGTSPPGPTKQHRKQSRCLPASSDLPKSWYSFGPPILATKRLPFELLQWAEEGGSSHKKNRERNQSILNSYDAKKEVKLKFTPTMQNQNLMIKTRSPSKVRMNLVQRSLLDPCVAQHCGIDVSKIPHNDAKSAKVFQ